MKKELINYLLPQVAEQGKVAIIESGMDCDCNRYSGHVTIVEATLEAVQAHVEHAHSWADGPIYFGLARPSEAERIRYESRDLAAEAHEDGHSHHIHGG